MMMRLAAVFLLFTLPSIVVNAEADDACTAAYNDAVAATLLGDDCTTTDSGTCPDSCQELFDDLKDVCDGKTYLNSDGEETPYNHQGTVIGYKILLDEECADAIDAGDADTCDGAYKAASLEILTEDTCEDDASGNCPQECFDLFEDVHNVCEGSFYLVEDEEREYNAKEVESTFKIFMGGACADANFAPSNSNSNSEPAPTEPKETPAPATPAPYTTSTVTNPDGSTSTIFESASFSGGVPSSAGRPVSSLLAIFVGLMVGTFLMDL